MIVLPSKRKTKIKSIEEYKESIDEAFVSMPIVLTMEEELDIMRGSVLVKQGYKPLMNHILKSKIVWMNDSPLREGKEYLLKSNTQCVPVQIKRVLYKYDLNELTHLATDNLSLNDIATKFKFPIAKLKRELEMGVEVELEHTKDKGLAKDIAMDPIS